jgi:hypothetical protein
VFAEQGFAISSKHSRRANSNFPGKIIHYFEVSLMSESGWVNCWHLALSWKSFRYK